MKFILHGTRITKKKRVWPLVSHPCGLNPFRPGSETSGFDSKMNSMWHNCGFNFCCLKIAWQIKITWKFPVSVVNPSAKINPKSCSN